MWDVGRYRAAVNSLHTGESLVAVKDQNQFTLLCGAFGNVKDAKIAGEQYMISNSPTTYNGWNQYGGKVTHLRCLATQCC